MTKEKGKEPSAAVYSAAKSEEELPPVKPSGPGKWSYSIAKPRSWFLKRAFHHCKKLAGEERVREKFSEEERKNLIPAVKKALKQEELEQKDVIVTMKLFNVWKNSEKYQKKYPGVWDLLSHYELWKAFLHKR